MPSQSDLIYIGICYKRKISIAHHYNSEYLILKLQIALTLGFCLESEATVGAKKEDDPISFWLATQAWLTLFLGLKRKKALARMIWLKLVSILILWTTQILASYE